MSLTAGERAVFTINCNLHGCGNWNSGYNLFELNSNVSVDLVTYSPITSSLSIGLRGSTPYSFTPQAFNAGTINVGALNATTINGSVSGASINSGTISAARLPLFGPSGSAHAPGIVPDPGATAGSTRFLREDGTWVAPSGGGGSCDVQIGGDLGGTNSAPVVAGIQGKPVSATAPTNAQALVWSSSLNEYVPSTVTAAPPVAVEFYPAAVSDGGTAFAAAWTRYDNNEPQTGSVNPAASALGYMAFQPGEVLHQFAELTLSEPPYWTGTSISFDFFSSATTGNVAWQVQAGCIPANTALTTSYSTPSFSTTAETITAVSSTANGLVTTATLSNFIAPGVGGCPSSPTTPTKVTYRIFRDPMDTAAGNANFLGATLLTGRSQ